MSPNEGRTVAVVRILVARYQINLSRACEREEVEAHRQVHITHSAKPKISPIRTSTSTSIIIIYISFIAAHTDDSMSIEVRCLPCIDAVRCSPQSTSNGTACKCILSKDRHQNLTPVACLILCTMRGMSWPVMRVPSRYTSM